MKHAIYSQCYNDDGRDITCWWGISGESMSFLVIDASNGSSTNAAFRLSTGDDGSRGILECADSIRCIDIAGTVLYLTEDCVGGASLPMSAAELTAYLNGRKHPLSLSGIKSYLRDSPSARRKTQ